MSRPSLLDELLAAVPDVPANVDTRGVLLEGPELHGDAEGFVAVRPGRRLLAAVGRPSAEAFREALRSLHPEAELVASGVAVEAARRYLGSAGELAWVHSRGLEDPRTVDGGNTAVLLEPGAPLNGLSDEIRHEIRAFGDRWPVAAVVVEGSPVAVCYPAVTTERHWDVSVETLAGHRRRGYAEATFHRLVPEMAARGLEPIWGALASNRASLALAAKLGFERVGQIVVFSLAR